MRLMHEIVIDLHTVTDGGKKETKKKMAKQGETRPLSLSLSQFLSSNTKINVFHEIERLRIKIWPFQSIEI